ncbi:MAG: hypothetical protein R6X34_13220 [Chloroflexota bacterium]
MSKNQKNISVVVAVVLMLFTAVLVATRQNRSQSAAVPEGYRLLGEVDLSGGPYAEAVVGEFVAAETAVTRLYLSLPNLDTSAFNLSLQGADGTAYPILQAANYRTNQDGGGDWQETLPPGRYQLRLTAAQSTGSVAIYHHSQPAQ